MDSQKQTAPSWTERWARNLIIQFLNDFIASGRLILLEEDGTVLTFGATEQKGFPEVEMKVHNPLFYWRVATEADMGFADAYINKDISFVDEDGLRNLITIFISNRDLKASVPSSTSKRGWWTPMFLSAALASAKYFFKHVLRQNTLTQSRQNIAQHYDLSNELFSMFMDETMTYTAAIFKSPDEELKDAQLRKISSIIRKAKISKEHHVLEFGFGWGTFAIEAVKKTGCQYTGITLSENQMKYAEQKVKEAGLQDKIKLMLCDYRQLPDACKYDRIIVWGMLEHVGYEYYEKFFSCCESALADNGILLIQFSWLPDQRYEEYVRSSDFIREYMFPGGCLPTLSRVVAAMTAASRLCVQSVENYGIHYYHTLRHWKKNFLKNRSEILALGFDEKFIRTWEYYFDYCAAGMKTCALGDSLVIFTRPGNVLNFGKLEDDESSPSAN